MADFVAKISLKIYFSLKSCAFSIRVATIISEALQIFNCSFLSELIALCAFVSAFAKMNFIASLYMRFLDF